MSELTTYEQVQANLEFAQHLNTAMSYARPQWSEKHASALFENVGTLHKNPAVLELKAAFLSAVNTEETDDTPSTKQTDEDVLLASNFVMEDPGILEKDIVEKLVDTERFSKANALELILHCEEIGTIYATTPHKTNPTLRHYWHRTVSRPVADGDVTQRQFEENLHDSIEELLGKGGRASLKAIHEELKEDYTFDEIGKALKSRDGTHYERVFVNDLVFWKLKDYPG